MRLLALFAVAGLFAVAAAPAHATFLKNVTIDSQQNGPFTVTETGSGVLCPSGQASTPFAFLLRSVPNGVDIGVGKHFVCDDGSGTFDMFLAVRLRFFPEFSTDNYVWMVTAGTGQYEDLQGFGTGYGEPNIDHYSGRVGISPWDFGSRQPQ